MAEDPCLRTEDLFLRLAQPGDRICRQPSPTPCRLRVHCNHADIEACPQPAPQRAQTSTGVQYLSDFMRRTGLSTGDNAGDGHLRQGLLDGAEDFGELLIR